jgi:hypothetical protein
LPSLALEHDYDRIRTARLAELATVGILRDDAV